MKKLLFIFLLIPAFAFSQQVVEKKILALQFTGDNFTELKKLCPQLEKYTFRSKEEVERIQGEQYKLVKSKPAQTPQFKGYTVGWKVQDVTFGESMTEALPGFWIIKQGGECKILPPDEFEKEYQ